MKIYLVEDDTIYADFIKKSLSSYPVRTIKLFHTAEDCLKDISGSLPDVMIIDYKLPGMSGIDLYEKITGDAFMIPTDANVKERIEKNLKEYRS